MRTIQNAFSRFFRLESASSIVLIISAVIAVILANSNLSETYFSILETKVSISAGEFSLSKTVIHWINDGLMVIFFFLIGLEIKRELIAGELDSWKKSSLPIIAAVGGMLIPISIYFFLNTTEEGIKGWGVPMATDIAFSLGVLTLLGKRVPLSLKIFLTAFAIIDDLGAVIVIAVFYSSKIYMNYIYIALVIYVVLIILTYIRVNARILYLLLGIVFWYLFLKSGIHPTIAGVMMAFVIPINRRVGKLTFINELGKIVNSFKGKEKQGVFLSNKQLHAIEKTDSLVYHFEPYLQRLERKLHGFVAFFVMPVFALANAGVEFGTSGGGLQINSVAWHVGVALLLGKIIGITSFSYFAVKLKIASLPKQLQMKHIFAVSFLGGVGFTMALFINSLAFTNETYLNSAKFGIIASSIVAGFIGYFVLKNTLKE